MIVYGHDQENRRTYALELPNAQTLLAIAAMYVTNEGIGGIKGEPSPRLRLGTAKVHPNDQYSKKDGRLTASEKLAESSFEVGSVVSTKTHTVLRLQHKKVLVIIKVSKDQKNIHCRIMSVNSNCLN